MSSVILYFDRFRGNFKFVVKEKFFFEREGIFFEKNFTKIFDSVLHA